MKKGIILLMIMYSFSFAYYDWPMDDNRHLTSAYGPRYGYDFHSGYDMIDDEGSVYGTKSGIVKSVGWNSIYGYHIFVYDDNDSMGYGHIHLDNDPSIYFSNNDELDDLRSYVGEMGSSPTYDFSIHLHTYVFYDKANEVPNKYDSMHPRFLYGPPPENNTLPEITLTNMVKDYTNSVSKIEFTISIKGNELDLDAIGFSINYTNYDYDLNWLHFSARPGWFGYIQTNSTGVFSYSNGNDVYTVTLVPRNFEWDKHDYMYYDLTMDFTNYNSTLYPSDIYVRIEEWDASKYDEFSIYEDCANPECNMEVSIK